MSLSQDPAFSLLKKYFVCGFRDITNLPYAGLSGRHDFGGNAVDTTNGAGPHNLQLFFMSADGVVLNVLPGYWHSQDLVPEMQFAAQLNQVWEDPALSRGQKDAMFRQMHLDHISQHPQAMVRRSRMQGFDMKYEAEHRLATSDTIRDRQAASLAIGRGAKAPAYAFKTTDEIMHERMANHPFERYEQFDVGAFADYGKPKYDKHEDYRTADGQIDKTAARNAPQLGNRMAAAGDRQPGMRRRRMMQTMQQRNTGTWGNGGPKWGVAQQQY